MDNLGTEQIYLNLKSKSKKNEQMIITTKLIEAKNQKDKKNNENRIKIFKKINIFPKDKSIWIYNSFKTYINNNYFECPFIPKEENWIQIDSNKKTPLEISNFIYQLEDEINYDEFNNLIKGEIILKGESKFWIFLHCEEKFNDKTVVITFSKKEFCKRCFVSLGTFINKKKEKNNQDNMNKINNINNIKNKIDNMEQKILYESNADASRIMSLNNSEIGIHNLDNNIYINIDNNIDYNYNINNQENDECNEYEYEFVNLKTQELVEEINLKEKEKMKTKILNNYTMFNIITLDIKIFDDGQIIKIKIKLNNGNYENEIEGNFFIPALDIIYINNNTENIKSSGYKIRIAGSGEGCAVNSFSNEINCKDKKYRYNKGTNGCICCNLY